MAGGILARDPSPGAPPAPATAPAADAPKYTLTLSDGIYANVDQDRAVALLDGAEQSLRRAVDLESGEWAEVNKGRLSFFGAIGGALTDLAGQDFPSYEATWRDVENAMIAARKELRAGNVEAAATSLREGSAAFDKGREVWHAYKAQLEGAGTKAQEGIVVVAVLAIAVIATGGALAGALTPAAPAAAGGGVVVGGGVGGAAALGATAPVDAAAAGLATTGVAGGGGAVVGGGAGVGSGAALGTTVPVAGGGTAAAVGATTVVGVGGATADAIIGTAIADTSAALASGGPAAATATAEGLSVGVLEAVYGRLAPVLAMNAPFTTAEARALKQVADIIFAVWHGRQGFPGVPPG